MLRTISRGKRLFIITDRNVFRLYGRKFPDAEAVIVIGTGEKIKDLDTVSDIYRKLLEKGADRRSFLLGIGGGVVCDITGFVASTYMRGMDFGFVPTTLLAQVDASLGGKNGINLNRFKNIVGVIRQPKLIFQDTSFLKTLSDQEYKSGVAEIIKHAIIKSPSLFKFLETHSGDILRRKPSAINRLIRDSIKIKMGIVKKDRLDNGQRMLLNFGHTYGHALEAVSRNKITHGEAVSIGMAFSARLSFLRGYTTLRDVARIEKLISKFGLPVSLSSKRINLNALLSAIEKDKKRERKKIDFIFIRGIGKAFIGEL